MPYPTFLAPDPTGIRNPLGVEQGAVYTLIGPDGTRAVVNDPSDRDFVGFLDAPPTGLESAGIRENADTLAEADGGIHGTFFDDRRPWTLSGILPPDVGPGTWLQRQAKLKRAARARKADGLLLWTPSEAPPVQVAFREQQATRITGRRPKSFLVTGVCEDPLIYSQALHTVQITPQAAGAGGFTSPLTSPLESAASQAGTAVAANAGDEATWPAIAVYGPCSNPVLVNASTGEAIYLTYSLNAGEYLSIDTDPRRRTVRLNDLTNRYRAYDYSRSSWWALEPGDNTLQIGFATYSAGATVVVQWHDAWG